MKKIIVISLIVVSLVFIFLKLNKLPKQKLTFVKSNTLTPTPFPLQELTIPALRERTYKSSLGELSQYMQNGAYTSYLTSYDSDGFKVNGLLTKPEGEMPPDGWPAIVFIHGYIPPKQYVTTEKYIAYVDTLARNGFVVFKIDLRGNGDSEGTARGAYYSADYVVDTLHAYAALQTSGFVNPNKIGLWGHSMAGNAVMRSIATNPSIPASVIWAGAVYTYEDMQKYRINDNSYQRPPEGTQMPQNRQRLGGIYGEPNLNHFFWKQLAPVTYLADLKGVVQLHHAVNDLVVNIGYSRDLVSLLKDQSPLHELYEYETGGHNIEGYSFNSAIQRTVEFYKKYL